MSTKLWAAACVLALAAALPALPAAAKKKDPPLPAVAAAPAAETAKPPLTSGDRLLIKVVGEADLSKEYVVDETGAIQVEMIGPVKAAGLTVAEFEAALAKQLARIIRRPQFTITAMQRVGVAGGVHTPGAYDFPKEQPVRLIDALLRAGGMIREAKKGRILLVRKATAPGQPNAQLYDIGRFLKKGTPADNPLLGPNDLVYVDVEDAERKPKGIAAILEKALPLATAFF